MGLSFLCLLLICKTIILIVCCLRCYSYTKEKNDPSDYQEIEKSQERRARQIYEEYGYK